MKIALCNGGLGNQTFQYIFSRFIELAGGSCCYLDDSSFFLKEAAHNGFEMRRVFPNCRPKLLSEYFSEDVWEYMVQRQAGGEHIIQQWKNEGEDFTLVAEALGYQYDGNIVKIPTNEYLPWLAGAEGNIYYFGYWINKNYLKGEFEKILRAELGFAPLVGEKNRGYERRITETNSVALHVRRRDFVEIGWDSSVETYAAGVSKLRETVSDPHFFIFSDDMEWCRENLKDMGIRAEEATFVEGNRGIDSYIDMQLMACCKNIILATSSSFAYLATLLNRNESIFVVNGTGREV